MSEPSAHSLAFVEEAKRRGCLCTLTKRGQYLVLKVGERDVLPFWSSRSKAELILAFHEDYGDYQVFEVSVDDFCSWLPEIQEQDMAILANWSGKSSEGPCLVPGELRKLLVR